MLSTVFAKSFSQKNRYSTQSHSTRTGEGVDKEITNKEVYRTSLTLVRTPVTQCFNPPVRKENRGLGVIVFMCAGTLNTSYFPTLL